MRKIVRALALSLFGVLLAPGALRAEKSLFWRRMDVAAKLDAQGVLHVAERQAIVFTGDWNGGERKFRVAPGQRLRVTGLSRQDETGQMRPLSQGSLSDVDHYAFTDPTTLRWRSRLPSDPPFEGTEILYELDYDLSGILLNQGGTYVLNHDFAFPDRSGRIEAFTLDLTLDPAWKSRTPVPSRLERGPLAPGAGVVIRLELEHTGGAKPSAVRLGTSRGQRLGFFLLFLGAVLVLGGAFYLRESGLGRFAPLPPPEAIDAAWLEKKIFTLRPEEVGALWDETIGAPEVAAVLARLAGEKKIESTAEGKKLTMHLSVPLSELEGYEKKLLEALFFDGRKETDTDAIRARYKSKGFDPSSKIKEDLEKRLSIHADFGDRSPRPRRWPTLVLMLLAVAAMVLAKVGGADGGAIIGVAMVYGGLWGIAVIPASFWQKRMHNFLLPALGFLWLPAGLLYASALGIATFAQTAPLFLVGLLFFKLAIVNNLFNVAKTRNGPHRIARRKMLIAAKEFFARELKSPQPRLEDRWFPYIVAFGLSSGVGRWFRAYGGEQAAVASRTVGTASSGGSQASPSGGWTGGGGSFGGAGASASWAAAAGALAAGVSAPSSGGSGGGGGGGGGSSGGGGGGGW